jgi:putative tryptophan/tyrosine transport system substrate-binding protein
MRRRDFVTLLGGAAVVWPLVAHPQQPSTPVIGFLSSLSQAQTQLMAAWRRGLGETGYDEGKTVTVEYRFADGQYDRLTAFAAEFVRRPVDLIVAIAPPAALAAKVATTTIPIVFVVGLDPVAAGLVASFNEPGGNATGMTLIAGPLGQKRLEILRELGSKSKVVPVLVNPTSPDSVPEIRDVQAAARTMGLELRLINASTPTEIEVAFAAIAQLHPDGLLVTTDPFFTIQRDQIVRLATQLKVPTVYPFREFAAAGGLVSYGANIANAWRQVGIYVGRILKGDKPADLAVMQPTTFELVINLKTARDLNINIPATLHARSDDVIE